MVLPVKHNFISKPMGKQENKLPILPSEVEDSKIEPANPTVPLEGIPDFHVVEEVDDHVRMAPMKIDKDIKGRVNTGTGDQPGNTGGSRFATPSGSTGEDIRH